MNEKMSILFCFVFLVIYSLSMSLVAELYLKFFKASQSHFNVVLGNLFTLL